MMQAGNQSVKRPKITGLSYMSFQARDVEKTLSFYKDMLGCEDLKWVKTKDGRTERVFVKFNDAQFVELQPEKTSLTDRMIQFGFQVEDAEAMRVYLLSKGIAVPKAVSVGPTGNPGFLVKDPDNHSVEFIQYVGTGWPVSEAGKKEKSERVSSTLLHFGFICYSLEKSMAFYRDILDFSELWRGSADDKKLSWVQLRLPEDKNYIELMLYDEKPSLERLGILNHYGLEVPSVPGAVESVMKRPSFVSYPRELTHKIGTCRHRLSNLFDPDGTRAEFMERPTFDGSVTPSSPVPPPR